MTRQRNDSHSTEFGLWLRQQKEIDSLKGNIITNIDYVHGNFCIDGDPFLIYEEKRHGHFPTPGQSRLFKRIDKCCRAVDKFYMGFHLLIFENTSPDDGGTFLDGHYVTKTELLEFLQFKKPEDWYRSYFYEDDSRLPIGIYRLTPKSFEILAGVGG